MSNFVTNVLKLVSGSVVAQSLSLLLIPVITRLYSPENLGIFQLFISISGILVVFSSFSYQLSIMLPKKDEDSANIAVLCVLLIIFISALSGIAALILAKNIEELLNAPGISEYLILLPVVVLINGLFFVMNYWLSRKSHFGVIAGARISNTLSGKVFQIGLARAGASPLGLITGFIAGYVFADLFMFRGIKKDLGLFRKASVKRMKELAIQYKKFPLYTTWSTVSNTISIQIPSFLLAFFYGTTVVGYYSLANQAVNLPMGIVGNAIGQVFFKKITEVKNKNGNVQAVVSEVYKKLISIGIFPMMTLMIMGEEIFTFIFGTAWHVSGLYVRVLVPWIFLVFISSPISTLYNVFEKQEVWLNFSIILLISRVAVLFIGGTYGGPLFTLGLFALTGVIFWGWNNLYLLKIAGIAPKESVSILTKYLIIALLASIPLILIKMVSLNFYIMFFVLGIVTILYYSMAFYKDAEFKKIVYFFFPGGVRHER